MVWPVLFLFSSILPLLLLLRTHMEAQQCSNGDSSLIYVFVRKLRTARCTTTICRGGMAVALTGNGWIEWTLSVRIQSATQWNSHFAINLFGRRRLCVGGASKRANKWMNGWQKGGNNNFISILIKQLLFNTILIVALSRVECIIIIKYFARTPRTAYGIRLAFVYVLRAHRHSINSTWCQLSLAEHQRTARFRSLILRCALSNALNFLARNSLRDATHKNRRKIFCPPPTGIAFNIYYSFEWIQRSLIYSARNHDFCFFFSVLCFAAVDTLHACLLFAVIAYHFRQFRAKFIWFVRVARSMHRQFKVDTIKRSNGSQRFRMFEITINVESAVGPQIRNVDSNPARTWRWSLLWRLSFSLMHIDQSKKPCRSAIHTESNGLRNATAMRRDAFLSNDGTTAKQSKATDKQIHSPKISFSWNIELNHSPVARGCCVPIEFWLFFWIFSIAPSGLFHLAVQRAYREHEMVAIYTKIMQMMRALQLESLHCGAKQRDCLHKINMHVRGELVSFDVHRRRHIVCDISISRKMKRSPPLMKTTRNERKTNSDARRSARTHPKHRIIYYDLFFHSFVRLVRLL